VKGDKLINETGRENTIAELREIADDLERGCGGFNWLIGFDFSGGWRMSLQEEIERLKKKFEAADESKVEALNAMIEQAAYETLYLKRLNEQAIVTGLVKFHPDNPSIQQTLPISGEIAKHGALLTNITDKLMKHLSTEQDDDDDGLGEFE
jgi:hypothetical protein